MWVSVLRSEGTSLGVPGPVPSAVLGERPGGGLWDVGGVHVARHVGLLLELGLQQRVLHHADPHVHLDDLLLQLGEALPDLHHRSCGRETERGRTCLWDKQGLL